MIEVAVTLQFNQYCLGNCRYKTVSRFLHDANDRVMFLPTWWAAVMRYAAQLLNKHQAAVKHIDWDPVIIGNPREYRRFYAQGRFTKHEAFYPGDIIEVHAVLPGEITLIDFRELLTIAGCYKGMSPYRPEDKYGTFEVLTVATRRRAVSAQITEEA